MFDTYFRAAGGRFAGGLEDGVAPRGATPFATLESPPLWDIVRDVNKLSNNVMARQIFLTLATANAPPPATTAHARPTPSGAGSRGATSRRRSSCSTTARASRGASGSPPGSLARLLIAADKSAVREEFASSLAVAATDGTVQRRFQNGTVAGQALLKTGTLDGARALAGYVHRPGRPALRGRRDRQRRERGARAERARLPRSVGLSATPPSGRRRRADEALTRTACHIPGTGFSSLNSR